MIKVYNIKSFFITGFCLSIILFVGFLVYQHAVTLYAQGQVITPIEGGGGCEKCDKYEETDICEHLSGREYEDCYIQCSKYGEDACFSKGECIKWVPRDPLPLSCQDDDNEPEPDPECKPTTGQLRRCRDDGGSWDYEEDVCACIVDPPEYENYTMSVTKSGNGSGTVTSNTFSFDTIDCGADCTSSVEIVVGDSVPAWTLLANPASNSEFVRWTDSAGRSMSTCNPTSTSCTWSGGATLNAEFRLKESNLQVTSQLNGSSINGVQITAAAPYNGTTPYTRTSSTGINTTLTAPAIHTHGGLQRAFQGWTGCTTTNTTNRTCGLNVASGSNATPTARYVNATLTATLGANRNINVGQSVTFTPTIGGTATPPTSFRSPSCGAPGITPTTPTSNGSFTCTYTNPGRFRPSIIVGRGGWTVTADTRVEADRTTVTVNPNITATKGSGNAIKGTLTSNPAGINCGTSCTSASANFTFNNPVTLTANPNTGSMYLFHRWTSSGGNSNTKSITFPATVNRTYTANFYGPYEIQPPIGGGQVGINADGSRITTTYTIQPNQPDDPNIQNYFCDYSTNSRSTTPNNNFAFNCTYTTPGNKNVRATISHNGNSVTPTLTQNIKYAPAAIDEFRPDPDWIRRDTDGVDDSGESTLRWTVRNATSCTITGGGLNHPFNPGPIDRVNNGSLEVTGVSGTTIYTLTCTNLDNVSTSRTTRLNVLPVYQEF